jgi:predicted lipoprotein with Yx(FWY)xxD motif
MLVNKWSCLVAGLCFAATAAGGPRAEASSVASLTTPAGITLQVKRGANYSYLASFFNRGSSSVTYYADAGGRPLYFFDGDTESEVSACTAECAQSWLPAQPPRGVRPSGDWSVETRPDKIKQWAFRGKPLYLYSKDTAPGEPAGEAAGGKQWHLARFESGDGTTTPVGLSFGEAIDIHGVLLLSPTKRAVYQYVGDPNLAENTCIGTACESAFEPLLAPTLAQPIGEFSPTNRANGLTQWSYQGKLLFTYNKDLYPGAVKGHQADARWRPVVRAMNFSPRNVHVIDSLEYGPMWATSAGMTLYVRDTYRHNPTLGGFRADLFQASPAVGLDLGTRGCDAVCLKMYRPLKAQKNDVPSGYWTIYQRNDGFRQWAYKGYAVYTYVLDKASRDTLGVGSFDYLLDDGDGRFVDPGIASLKTSSAQEALFWRVALP